MIQIERQLLIGIRHIKNKYSFTHSGLTAWVFFIALRVCVSFKKEVCKNAHCAYRSKVQSFYCINNLKVTDPPYNTGNDFVYEDDFAQSADEYLENSGQFDDEGNRLVKNLDSNGRFHTDWLNMIYPRLKLAKDLLAEDGVIFISIDDAEVSNLRKICDDAFGADNFVANLIWQKKFSRSNDAKYFSTVTAK